MSTVCVGWQANKGDVGSLAGVRRAHSDAVQLVPKQLTCVHDLHAVYGDERGWLNVEQERA